MHKLQAADSLIYQCGLAIAFTISALLLTWLFWPVIHNAPFLFFYGAVVLSAWRGGLVPGMVSAAIAIVSLDYFLLEPRYVVLSEPSDLLEFGIFSLVSILLGWLEENRNRSEQSLRELKDELDVILQSVADGIIVQDSQGRVVFSNSAARELTGYPSSFLLSDSLVGSDGKFELFDEQGAPLPPSMLPHHHVLETGEIASMTLKLRFSDTGEEKWIYLTSSPVISDKREATLAVNVLREITTQIENYRSRAQLAAIVQNSNDAIIGKNRDSIIQSWNSGAERLYGYKAEEAIGKPISMLFPEDIKHNEMRLSERISAGEQIRHYETRRVHKDGHLIDISLTISPICNSEQNIVGYSSIQRDITYRKKREAELERLRHASEAQRLQLETIIANIPGIVYLESRQHNADKQGMLFISETVETMLGYSADDWETLHDFWKQIVHPDDWELFVGQMDKTHISGKPATVAFRCTTQAGKTIHVEARSSVLRDNGGRHIGDCGVIMDVTEHKQVQDNLRQTTILLESLNNRWINIVQNIPGIIFETTIDFEKNEQQYNFISENVETVLGYPPEKWKINPGFWLEIIPSEDAEAALEDIVAAYQEERPGKTQARVKCSNGKLRHLEANFHFAKDEKYVRSYGVIMDITERKLIEEALKNHTEDLRRSNEELEQFAYVASHDLQEPLRMVTSYLQLVAQRYQELLDEDGKEFIDFAIDGATRMKALINDLLTYSRVQRNATEVANVDMENVLGRVIQSLQAVIEETQAIITHDQLPQIVANEAQMIQLLQNLISNALKFHGDQPPQVHVSVRQFGDHWRFSVSDKGIGIAPEYQARIFVIFQRLHTRQEYEGTGIGLAICRKIIDKHDGKIWVESQPGAGATFYFAIPTHGARG